MTGDRTVIFLHIGKTAGSTLRQVLKRQFPSSQVMTVRARRRPREETLSDFARLPETERLRPRLIMGHTVFGLHEGVPRPSTYITMLRQPVRLAHSQYRYVLRTPGHRHHEAAQGMSLEEYVESGLALEMDNSQTRAIAGDIGTPFGECTAEMLELAKRHLDEHFSWVGLTERFDESLLLLRRTLEWRDVRYVSVNVARSRSELTPAQRELIERRNRLDLELYEHAGRLFDARIAAEPGFADELRRFRRANSRYRAWGRLTYTWPSAIKRRIAPEVR
ncbi:MAG TPA: hypothetical protein VE777_07595 [Gaiellales bacterium]|jgi:hypothetical protein|nr:hypothetical protein [Gaiellales bacterium]